MGRLVLQALPLLALGLALTVARAFLLPPSPSYPPQPGRQRLVVLAPTNRKPPPLALAPPLQARRKVEPAAAAADDDDEEEEEEEEEEDEEDEEDEEIDPLAVVVGGDGGGGGKSFPMDLDTAPEEAEAESTTPWDNFVEILLPPGTSSQDDGEGGGGGRAADGSSGSGAAASVGDPPSPNRYFMRTDVPYYFLRDELGLGEERMLRVSLDHGQVLALSVERSLRPKVAWLRGALQLSRAEAAQVVGASPNLLLLSVEDNLAPKLRWLKDELALSDAERRGLVLRCPQLLTASTGSLLLKLAFLKDDVGLTPPELGRAVRTMPPLLVLSLDTLVDKAEFLTQELGMTMKDVGHLLVRGPALFFQALDTGLRPKVRFLRRDLGLGTEQLRTLVLRAPRLLNYRVAARGRALLAYLTRPPLELSREDAVRLVLKAPGLLGMDAAGPRFHAAVRALQEVTGVGSGRDLGSVVQRFPGALSLSAPRIRATQQLLVGPPLQCTAQEAAEVLWKHPQALGYRPEAVRGKLAAVAAAYGLAPDNGAVKAALLKAPALLSYSLDGRLKPRLQAAAAAGVAVERAVTMLSLPAERFKERVDRCAAGPVPDLPPLLRQRANARLRKLLLAQRTERRESEQAVEKEKGKGQGGKEGKAKGNKRDETDVE